MQLFVRLHKIALKEKFCPVTGGASVASTVKGRTFAGTGEER